MPAGPEEARDWAAALDRVANGMATHERHQRTVAQSMAAYQERLAVLELKLEEAVACRETTRSYLSEACGNMLTKFVKVEDMTQRDEPHREDMSSLQICVHHNLDGQSILVARVEALEAQIRNLLQGQIPPPGFEPANISAAQPSGPAVQFDLGTPQEPTSQQPVPEDVMQQTANDAWAQSLAAGGSPFRQPQESSTHAGAGPEPAGASQAHGPPRAQERPVPGGAAFSTADSIHAAPTEAWGQYRPEPAHVPTAQPQP